MRRSPSMSTGTTGFEPMYPMIPHISQSLARAFPFVRPARLLPLNPSVDVRLSSSSNAKRAGRHVLGNR